jgi:arylsulfatase A-like enzyme
VLVVAALGLTALVSPAAAAPHSADAGPRAGDAASTAGRARRPNILFVLTDDMTLDDLRVMPGVRRVVGRAGMRFTRAMVSVSLCCPSRTTILRGQYAHNTGVESNGGTNGGFETAYRLGVERSTLATWLQRAGYRTALIGKYLNGYPNTAPANYRPPGWTDWVTPDAGNPYNEYGYRLNVNGVPEVHGSKPSDYGTTVYLRHARRFIADSARAHRPWFLDLSLYAPHRPATPAPRDIGSAAGVRLPHPPSFNEPDIRDKPRWLRQVPRMRAPVIARSRALYQRRLESLRAVDRGVVGLVRQLHRSGQLDDTYVVFMSDNGFHTGQHRLPAGKKTAFDEDQRVPLLVRGPGVEAGSTNDALVGNVDVAPTFARLAGAHVPSFVDGRSLVRWLHGERPRTQRRAFLIEHWREMGSEPRAPRLPLEPPDNDQTDTPLAPRAHVGLEDADVIPEFHGLRTADYTYVEYVDGERELYDLRHDPYELVNVYDRTTRPTRIALEQELGAVVDCRGRLCRAGDARPAVRLRFEPVRRRPAVPAPTSTSGSTSTTSAVRPPA